jgi:hypothetical protein
MLGQGPFGRPNLAALTGVDSLVVAPALFESQGIIHAPIMVNVSAVNLLPSLVPSATQFYGISIIAGLGQVIPETFINHSSFPVHLIAHELILSTFPSSTSFFAPVVAALPVQNVSPGLFTNTTLFRVPAVDTELKFLSINLFVNSTVFHQPSIGTEYSYQYPIGSQLDSDYGIREAMTFYKQRLVLGHRYGRRR